MQDTFKNFRGGVKFLDLSTQAGLDTSLSASKNPLGPLKELKGKWVGEPNHGWNIISIPDKGGFKFEVIPYREELTFNPKILVGADNVGPVLNGQEQNQSLFGLMYEQIINNTCTPISPEPQERKLPNGGTIPANFERTCKFEYDDVIHAETGFFLNIQNFDSNLNLTRLSTIPHGNSVLQLGRSSLANTPIEGTEFIKNAPVLPTALDGGGVKIGTGYGLDQVTYTQFPDIPKFNQLEPNSALRNNLEGKTILEMTTLEFSTEYDKAGILNIPFLQHNVEATKMTATFWIQKIKGEGQDKPDYWQLQYTQTIDLVFPVHFNPTPIIWPHVTVNTLRKVSDEV